MRGEGYRGHVTEPRREISASYQQQLDQGYNFGSVRTFGQRPLLTSPEQLDEWQPDVAVVGAPFDLDPVAQALDAR